MSIVSTSRPFQIRCHYRPLIFVATFLVLVSTFWFSSRYPQLLSKSTHLGEALPSMAFSKELISVGKDAPIWERVLAVAINWLDGMKIGMTFGILLGALLHTVLRYYPLKIGANLYLNSLKGALVGLPMGVCANCAVPTACGITRGHGRIEVALGFLFSSPNFNPVVVMMTFSALPWSMGVTKYALLLLLILVLVPGLISRLERARPFKPLNIGDESESCALVLRNPECSERFLTVLGELSRDFVKNVWMLLKPTFTVMLLASLASAAILTLFPWQELLRNPTPLKLALVSLISVLMPVPIALDVMFAAQLQQQGATSGCVMLFAMTLGTYSLIPTIYLWREVSKRLSVLLLLFFFLTGWFVGMIF